MLLDMGRQGVCLAAILFKGRQLKRRKGKGKGKGKGKSKRTGKAVYGGEQSQEQEWWPEEDFAWWFKGSKGKKGSSKGKGEFQKGGYQPYQQDKGAGKDQQGEQRQGNIPDM